MAQFNFYLDEKVTTWMRTEFSVEAETIEEAKVKAMQMHKDGELSEIGWDEIFGTKVKMDLEENDNFSTEELYLDGGELLYENGK